MKSAVFSILLICSTLSVSCSSDDDLNKSLINYEQKIQVSDCCNDPYCTDIHTKNKENKTITNLLCSIRSSSTSHEQKIKAYSSIQSFIETYNDENRPLCASSIKTILRSYNNQFRNTKTIYIDPLQNEFERLSKNSNNQQAYKKCSHCKRSVSELIQQKKIPELTALLKNLTCIKNEDQKLIKDFLEQEKNPIESKKALTCVFNALRKNAQIKEKKDARDLYMCNIDPKDKKMSCVISTLLCGMFPISVPVLIGSIYCCPLASYQD